MYQVMLSVLILRFAKKLPSLVILYYNTHITMFIVSPGRVNSKYKDGKF